MVNKHLRPITFYYVAAAPEMLLLSLATLQRLSAARDAMVTEARRRNDVERFHRLETDNNAQLHTNMKSVKRDVANEKQHLDELDKHCTDLASEVPCRLQWRSHTSGVRGVRTPCHKKISFGM